MDFTVFFIKYLRTLGFHVTNEIFANHTWYFSNALVRANYTDLKKNIHETTEYLELFLRNLLLNEKHELHNRTMHISGRWKKENLDIESKKPDIETEKPDIETEKPDIKKIINEKAASSSDLLKKLKTLEIIENVSGYGKGKYKFSQGENI